MLRNVGARFPRTRGSVLFAARRCVSRSARKTSRPITRPQPCSSRCRPRPHPRGGPAAHAAKRRAGPIVARGRAPSYPDAGDDLRRRFRDSESGVVPQPGGAEPIRAPIRPTRRAPTRPHLAEPAPDAEPEAPAPDSPPSPPEFLAARLEAFRAALDAGGLTDVHFRWSATRWSCTGTVPDRDRQGDGADAGTECRGCGFAQRQYPRAEQRCHSAPP